MTAGSLSVQIGIINCLSYDLSIGGSESVQTDLTLNPGDGLIAAIHYNFGDGTSWDEPGHSSVMMCNMPQPHRTLYAGAPVHTYPAPGAYQITATVTFSSCSGLGEQALTASITAYRIAGLRPRQN